MRLSETSSTVTGSVAPSSVKMRVMPTLRPTSPMVITSSFGLTRPALQAGRRLQLAGTSLVLLNLDLDVDARWQIELHERVYRLVGGVDDVHQPQMRADLELVARSLVDVRRAQQVEALLARRQRHRPANHRPGALRRVHDLERRLVDQAVVEGFETDSDALALHSLYSRIFATTPAPTVLPPSRMAKRSPCSIAIGVISVTTIFTLSPGITISVPLGSSTDPVTSVVRK